MYTLFKQLPRAFMLYEKHTVQNPDCDINKKF